jgi:hypothetical protein
MIRTLLLIIAASASAASAQVIYEPAVVQFGGGQSSYYYAGNNPAVHEAAAFPSVPGATFGRIPGYAFVSPTRQVVERHVRVFTDSFGTLDARPWGLTPNQAVNEANARLPRYFSKRDLLASAQTRMTPRGLECIVAPDAPRVTDRVQARGTVSIRPSLPSMYRGRGRGPLFSIPRSMMDRKVQDVIAPPLPPV